MKQKLATPPLPTPFDWNENIRWIEALIAALTGWITFIILYFKHKSKEKEEFIVNVVKATVTATLDSELKGIKENINALFKYREEDRKSQEAQFRELLKEIKK